MPNRILREGIISSKRMAALHDEAGWFGEVFYRRLMSKVDDFGCYEADPVLLRTQLFPRQLDMVREADMSRLLAVCEKSGLIRLYAVKGDNYLEMMDFHQQLRAKKRKFPAPESQMIITCAADATHVRSDIHSEAEAHSESEAEKIPLSEKSDEREKPGGKPAGQYPDGLLRFWKELPHNGRERSSKRKCLEQWKKHRCEAKLSEVMAGLERWKRSKKWTDDDGKYVGGAHMWLRDEQWTEHPAEAEIEELNNNGFVRAPLTQRIAIIAYPNVSPEILAELPE